MKAKLFIYPTATAQELGMTKISWNEFSRAMKDNLRVYVYAQNGDFGWWHCFDNRNGKRVYNCDSNLNNLLTREIKSTRNKK